MRKLIVGEKRTARVRRLLGALCMAAALLACPGALPGADAEVECRVVYETADGYFADAGAEKGVRAGSSGTIERGGAVIARVEAASVARSSSLLRVLSAAGDSRPRAGDVVRLAVSPAQPGEADPPAPGDRSATLKERGPDSGPGKGKEDFVPLLELPPGAAGSFPEPSSIFHGRLWARQLYQLESRNNLDHSLTRVGTSGNVERIEGTPWAFDWAGAASYRTGHAFRDSRDYQEVRPDVFRLAFSRRFDAGGMVRAGRFLPQELPAIGYIDGAQGETVLSEHFRLGAVAGLKPTRRDLDPSTDEPTAAGYATFEAGRPRELHYTGTAGVLGSLFRGKLDRLALLFDQRADLGPRFSLYSSTEADADIGGAETRSGLRLTREDVYAVSPVTSFLTLRAGADHYEIPDTRAEREALAIEDDRLLDRGYWRYWAGSTLYLPWRIELDGEAAYIESASDDGLHWRGGIARTGIFGWRAAQVRAVVYNLDGFDATGYGGRISAYLPLLGGDLSLHPAAGFRFLETDATSRDFDLTDLSLRAYWQISRAWSADAGVTYLTGTGVEAVLLEAGVSFRW